MENSNLSITKSFSNDAAGAKDENDPFKGDDLVDLDSFFLQSKQAKTDFDLDKLFKEEDKVKLGENADLENAGKDKEPKEQSNLSKAMEFASVGYFKEAFNVTTEDVMERVKYAVFPFRIGTVFKEKPYDLYGPLWILLTVVFTTSIFGTVFMRNDNSNLDQLTNTSIHQIGKSFVLTALYIILNPLVLYYQFTKEGARSVKYFEIVSIFGYSFTILPIIEVLLVLPVTLLKLMFLILGVFISTFFIRKELIELNKKYLPRKEVKKIKNYGIISHVVWLLIFKLLFL